MSRLISITAYAKDSTQFVSASPMVLNSDAIILAENASLHQRQSNPAASGSINTAITANYLQNNEGERHTFLISEVLSTLVTESA